jgi:hypothetical protein
VIRALVGLVLAGVLLGACGTITSAQATATWLHQSGYYANVKVLARDARKSAYALRSPSTSSVNLHTLCGVLFNDAGNMEQSLPSPDDQATILLDRATSLFAHGASTCYSAHANALVRAKALAMLDEGSATLAEATARLRTAAP